MIYIHAADKDHNLEWHQELWEFGGEYYLNQEEAVEAVEAMFGLLWGPVPSLLQFTEVKYVKVKQEKYP